MKTTFLTIVFAISIIKISFSQIKLPDNFHCVVGKNHYNESYFTDGVYNFSTYPWGHEGLTQEQVIKLLGVPMYKISNEMYWSTGKNGNEYFYLILDGLISCKLTSKKNDVKFSDYSKWLLEKLKYAKTKNLDTYFTDSKGHDALYYWNEKLLEH